MTRIPIACTLTADSAGDRLAEWRVLLDADVTSVERVDSGARLVLRPGDDVLLRAIDLAEREQACCEFLGFSLLLDRGGRALEVTVPDDAAARAILDALLHGSAPP